MKLQKEKYLKDEKYGVKASSTSAKANRIFLALSTINDDNRCSSNSYNIVSKADQATRRRSLVKLGAIDCPRRVEKIIRTYLLKFGSQCTTKYEEEYEKLSKQLDENKKKLVEMFLEDEIERFVSAQDPSISLSKRYFRIIQNRVSVANTRFTYQSLKKLAWADAEFYALNPIENEKTGVKEMDIRKY